MLNYNQVLTKDVLLQDLQMKEVKPIMKLVVRGKKREFISAVGKSLNILLPTEANTSAQSDKLTALWLSPDEWMIYSNNKNALNDNSNLEDKLFNEISKVKIGSVTNVTDHWIMINISGNNVFELLSAGCPFNFNAFMGSKGATTQTLLNHVDVIIHNKNINDLNLFVRRSFSNHLWSWINDAASRL